MLVSRIASGPRRIPGEKEKCAMEGFLTFVLILGGWLLLQTVILPKLGVPT